MYCKHGIIRLLGFSAVIVWSLTIGGCVDGDKSTQKAAGADGVQKPAGAQVPAGSQVDIFTVAGDRVRTLSEVYVWDGRNESGELVASGLYLFRVRYEDGTIGRGRLGVVR